MTEMKKEQRKKAKKKKEATKWWVRWNFTFTVIIRVIFVWLKLDPHNQVGFHGSELRQTKRFFQSHIRLWSQILRHVCLPRIGMKRRKTVMIHEFRLSFLPYIYMAFPLYMKRRKTIMIHKMVGFGGVYSRLNWRFGVEGSRYRY